MSVSRNDRKLMSATHIPTSPTAADEIYSVIADSKIRQLKGSMEKSNTSSSRVLHFSDGTLSLDDLIDDNTQSVPDCGAVLDPKTLPWAPWMWYQTLTVGSHVLRVCDFLGERLASFFGITTPKYQLEIEERLNMMKEEEEEREQALEDIQNWSGRKRTSEDFIERGDFLEDEVIVVSQQPTQPGGVGDAFSSTSYM